MAHAQAVPRNQIPNISTSGRVQSHSATASVSGLPRNPCSISLPFYAYQLNHPISVDWLCCLLPLKSLPDSCVRTATKTDGAHSMHSTFFMAVVPALAASPNPLVASYVPASAYDLRASLVHGSVRADIRSAFDLCLS